MPLTPGDTTATTLGEATIDSPLATGDSHTRFIDDSRRVLHDVEWEGDSEIPHVGFERAGARRKIYFDPAKSKAAIVTCGGLCPGINNVIRNLYYMLHGDYGVPEVLGIRFGFAGLNPEDGVPPMKLTANLVERIHHQGGTILGTSRGPQDPQLTVNFLIDEGINLLFCIGGDGTQRGAHAIWQEIARRKAKISVVGIPKTIDNDIRYCYRSFGYLTAVAEAEKVIDCAHTEARSVHNGIGLVKLMGREAGYITAAATIASGEVNFALIPEVPFKLEGESGLLARLERRLAYRDHAVIVVAEGAGQDLFDHATVEYDKSGNRKLQDIGPLLKKQILEHFAKQGNPVDVKYIDPSYNIRSVPANAADSLLCEEFARQAAHAAMAGKTDILVGLWQNRTVHVPLAMATGQTKRLRADSQLWTSVLSVTDQEKW